jgi:hypothetical protein
MPSVRNLLTTAQTFAEIASFGSLGQIVQIRWLPHACHVSAVTERGLEGLESAVLALTTSPAWMSQVDEMLKSSQGAAATAVD